MDVSKGSADQNSAPIPWPWILGTVGLMLVPAIGIALFSGALSSLNTSAFTPGQIEQGAILAREGQPIVKAINAYQAAMGKWPRALADLVPTYLPASADLKRWSYYLKSHSYLNSPSFGFGPVGDHSYYLYYEPEFGWLMAESPDNRPLTLGFNP